MPETNYAQELHKLEEAVDAIKEAYESAEGIEDITGKLDELTGRINAARENPDSLDADTFAELARDLMLVIPNNLPLPDAAKKAIEVLATVLASFIQGAMGIALSAVARRFRQALKAGTPPEQAAKDSAQDPAVQAWLLAQYRAGTITAAGDTRDTRMPWEWIWDEIVETVSGWVGSFFAMGRSPLPLVGCAVLLLALLAIGGALATGLIGGSPGGTGPTAADQATQPPAAATNPPSAETEAPAATEPPSPLTGSALALMDFSQTGGPCRVESFPAGFRIQAEDGALTLTQPVVGGDDHVSTGTVDRTGAWETMGDMQTYRGMFTGTGIRGEYMQPDGCAYGFRGHMDRPFLEPPPYGNAPGRFEFFDAASGLAGLALEDIEEGQVVHVIVASNGDPDIRALLPITIVLVVEGEEVWRFVIEGDPTAVCRDATGCSADAPTVRMAEWENEDVELLLIAIAADGTVIAVHAPHGMPPEPEF